MIGSSLELSGSIGKWSEGLVDVEIAKDYVRVKGYEKLKTEVARFRAWKEYKAQEAPPHAETSQPEKAVCPQCGSEVRPGKNFCNTCGAKLEWQGKTGVEEKGMDAAKFAHVYSLVEQYLPGVSVRRFKFRKGSEPRAPSLV